MASKEAHARKKHLARTLMTPWEIRMGASIFNSKEWNMRKQIKAHRVAAHQLAADMRRNAREKAKVRTAA